MPMITRTKVPFWWRAKIKSNKWKWIEISLEF